MRLVSIGKVHSEQFAAILWEVMHLLFFLSISIEYMSSLLLGRSGISRVVLEAMCAYFNLVDQIHECVPRKLSNFTWLLKAYVKSGLPLADNAKDSKNFRCKK